VSFLSQVTEKTLISISVLVRIRWQSRPIFANAEKPTVLAQSGGSTSHIELSHQPSSWQVQHHC
jgi:hypothetical protein